MSVLKGSERVYERAWSAVVAVKASKRRRVSLTQFYRTIIVDDRNFNIADSRL